MAQRPQPEEVRRVGIVGSGVIGAGWTAHFLRVGRDVIAWDPAPDSEARLRAAVEAVWPTMERLGLEPGASPERLRIAASVAEVAEDAEVIQENAPEDLEGKVALFAQLDAAAPPEVVLISSTSGLAMTAIQARCGHPERTAVGHPFNPPYLIPLVEVVGGERSAPETVDWVQAFYEASGKFVVKLRRELPGFIANRLQDAMWREALHMVAAGESTASPSTLRRSTPRSATGPAFAGRSWARASPSTLAEGLAACATCSTTSVRRSSSRGHASRRPSSPRPCASAWSRAASARRAAAPSPTWSASATSASSASSMR